MALLALTARQIFTPLDVIEDGVVLIEDRTIRSVGPRNALTVPANARVVDLGDRTIAPGFIDIHIHGGMGHDVMEGTPEALDAVARSIFQNGTTSFVPTTLSAPLAVLQKTLAGLRATLSSRDKRTTNDSRAEPLGIHLEGPFISVECRGVHPPEHLQAPSLKALEVYLEAAGEFARVLTLAPELDGAAELQAAAIARGLRVAVGHSNASYEQTRAAIDSGASHAVHVFNAMRPFTHRDPGVLGALLTDDRVYAEVIADGVHVAAPALQLLLRAKGMAKTVLVTDAVSATGMCPGRYHLGGMEIVLGDDAKTGLPSCRNAEGKLAGSVLTQDRAVRNMVAFAGATLQDAIRMATWNPACVLGVESRKGCLRSGADADLIVMDPSGKLTGVMSLGHANFL